MSHEAKLKTAKKVRRNCVKLAQNRRLGCWCGIASDALATAFNQKGFKAIMKSGLFDFDGHCWIECDGEIWDITATQFGFKETVLIAKIGDPRFTRGHIATKLRSWPFDQRPNKKMREILLKGIE